MSIARYLAVLLLSLSCIPCALSDVITITDSELKAGLVGSWVDPPDGDHGSILRARQVFKDDGTTLVYLYESAECREPVAAIRGTWAVANGVLTTQVTATTHPGLIQIGQIEHVDIVALESNRVVINADDKFYVREKSETCFHPNAHRT